MNTIYFVSELAARWNAEARRHELAAMDDEEILNLEVARVLRNCARELEEIT